MVPDGDRHPDLRETQGVASAIASRQGILHIDRLVALSSAVVLNAGPGVTIKEVVGHQVLPVGSRQTSVSIGDLAEKESKDIIVKFLVGEHRDGATVELLDAHLAYADAVVNAGRQERDAFLTVEATADQSEQQSGLDPETELVVARAVTAAVTLQVVARARSGDVAGARADLAAAEKHARALVKRTDVEALADLADELAVRADPGRPGPQKGACSRDSPATRPCPSRSRRLSSGRTAKPSTRYTDLSALAAARYAP